LPALFAPMLPMLPLLHLCVAPFCSHRCPFVHTCVGSFLLSFTHSLLMLSNIFLASGLTLIFSGDGVNGVNSKIPTKVVVMTSVAYAATVLGHSLVRILTVWPTQAIRKVSQCDALCDAN